MIFVEVGELFLSELRWQLCLGPPYVIGQDEQRVRLVSELPRAIEQVERIPCISVNARDIGGELQWFIAQAAFVEGLVAP